MMLGLFSVKFAVATRLPAQLRSDVPGGVRPSTLRRLSQPRTSTVPVVRVTFATATRLEDMREMTSTFVMDPLRMVAGSPEVTTYRPATSRDLMVAAGMFVGPTGKRGFTLRARA